MVLEQLKDGASRRLQVFDEGTRKLTFILCLPLIDGVFATLLVTGAVETFSSMVAVALTIFTGAGSLAVLYSYSETRHEAMKMVGKAAPVLITGAFLISLMAPIYEQLILVERMSYAAGLILLVIGLDMLDFNVADKMPPAAILVTALLLSVQNPSSLALSFEYVLPGLLTAFVASAGLLVASLVSLERLSLARVRIGGGLVLVVIAASMFGLKIPSEAILAVFGASILASFERLESLDFYPDV